MLQAQPRPGPREGLHVLRRARDGVLLLRSRRPTTPPSRSTRAGYFDLTTHDVGSASCASRRSCTLEAMGIPVEYSFHENGPSQHEIDLRYTDALDDGRQRDDVPARRQGGRARARRARHVHAQADRRRVQARACTRTCRCSRATSTRSTTRATSTACRRSRSTSSPACCTTPREITAVTNQWVNSYKRLIPGYEAPVYMCWARNNRSALVRVPLAEEGQERARPASSSARPTRRATRTSRSR